MERVFDIDSPFCQASFPKWSASFPNQQEDQLGNDIAIPPRYMPSHDQPADHDHDNYHLGYPGAVAVGLIRHAATPGLRRFRVARCQPPEKLQNTRHRPFGEPLLVAVALAITA